MRPGLTLAFSTRQRGPQIGRYIQHLRQSCGVDRLEILYQINPGDVSLTSLYNQFLEQASYPIVCLLHDDLRFARGSAWGRRLLQAFARWPDFAILSPAGSVALESHGIFWQPLQNMLGEVFHRLPQQISDNRYSERFEQPLEALLLDGLLLAVHTERIHQKFDPRIRGFHFYDVSLTLAQTLAHQRGEGGKCGVISGLGVTHLSGGIPDQRYFEARDHFLALYGSLLPQRLRPQLNLLPLAGFSVQSGTPTVRVLLWYRDAGISPGDLLQPFQTSRYARQELLVLNSTDQSLPAGIPSLSLPGIRNWSELNPWLLDNLSNSQAEFVLLLDNRVLPLQDWLPTMVQDFRRLPQLGTLGVRLHYPDTHLLSHNGLQLFFHPDGQPDVAIRGIHTPYQYRNALEWNPAGSALPLMLKRSLFLELGGLAGQDWLPGLELNLLAARAGWRHAVDSRLVGYCLAEEAGSEVQYQKFLRDFSSWFRTRL